MVKPRSLKFRQSIIFFCLLVFVVFGCFACARFNNKLTSKDGYISTIIVPHHDLVADKRSGTFKKIASRTQGRRIVLIAPNHYNSGTANIQTRSQIFTTQFRDIKVDKTLLNTALKIGVQENQPTFETEHGIKALLPDIAKYYPDNPILPLVIKQDAQQSELTNLLTALNKECQDCLLITSADFSHYQPYLLSKLHDGLTIRGLKNLDSNLLDAKAELEPMHHVWMAVEWAKLHDTKRFNLDQHTFSHDVVKDYYAEGTTHIMGWYDRGQREIPDPGVSFAITGPLNFKEGNSEFKQKFPKIYDQLGERVLWGTDLVVGNIATDNQTNKNILSKTLKQLHFTNIKTEDSLLVNNINAANLSEVTQIDGQNQKITLISGLTKNITEEKIKTHNVNNIIIYVDWAGISNEEQKQYAQTWIDYGADLVVGINGKNEIKIEQYKNRLIAYSLGDFVSSKNPENESIALVGEFTDKAIKLYPSLIKHQNYKPILARSKDADQETLKYFKEFKEFNIEEKSGVLIELNK